MMLKITYSQEQIDKMIASLIKMVTMSRKKVGIREGGLNVSIPVAKALNLPHYSVIRK